MMTKRIFALLLAFICAAALFGCGEAEKPTSSDAASSAEVSSEGTASSPTSEEPSASGDASSSGAVSEQPEEPIDYDDYNKTVLAVDAVFDRERHSITVTFVNNSEETFTFARGWSVEKKEGNKWYELEPKEPYMVTDDILTLSSFGDTTNSFCTDYYEFEPGNRYRLVKRFFGADGSEVFAGVESTNMRMFDLDIPYSNDAQPDDPAFVLTDGVLFLRLRVDGVRYWMKQNFSATLYYADLATTGDHAGVYSMYDALGARPTFCESDDGVVIEIPVSFWEGIPEVGHCYDLCLVTYGNKFDSKEIDTYKTRVTISETDAALFSALEPTSEIIDDPIVALKPVLYLYPEEETAVTVNVTFPRGEMTVCWPPYGEHWEVTASPDGTLRDADGYEYPYLYWEAVLPDFTPDFSTGFCVAGTDAGAFLRDTLSEMGLTPAEYTDFIVYWLPILQENAYNLISFQWESYTDTTALQITPAPDALLRVHMSVRASDTPVEIAPQEITPFERTGFTAVEWGGSIVG